MPDTRANVPLILHRLRRTSLGEAAWVTGIAVLLALHVASLLPPLVFPAQVDFTAFVENARAWLNGTPYPVSNRDPNLPHVIIAFVPFVYLSPLAGVVVWTLISYACMAATLWVVIRTLDLRPSGPLALTGLAILLGSRPVADIFVNANMIWPFAFLTTVAWRWARTGRELPAALLMGVLASGKPFLGGFLLLYVAKRHWRLAAGFAAGALGMLTVAVGLAGWTTFEAWQAAVRRIAWYDLAYNASIMGILARFWRPDVAFWLVASLLIAWMSYRTLRASRDADRNWLIAMLACILMAPLGWRYYLSLCAGPFIGFLLTKRQGPLSLTIAAAVLMAPAVRLESGIPVADAAAATLVCAAVVTAWLALLSPRSPDHDLR